MATVKQYADALKTRQLAVGRLMGADMSGMGSKELRVMNVSLLAMIGTLCKIISDKGLATDAEIAATLDGTVNDGWPIEPVNPPTTNPATSP